MTARTVRLDTAVAARFGLTRTKAAAVILGGQVTVNGQTARQAGRPVADGAVIEYHGEPPAVSRAAGKLAGALEQWPIPVDGLIVLDVGASTGGFTETALERGARHVYAVDVGHGQLAWPLRNDRRVTNLERTDIRKLDSLPETPDLATVDVSFISLELVLPSVSKLLRPGAPVVALFKPQFEVGRAVASKHRGVIRDSTAVTAAFVKFTGWAGRHGWAVRDSAESSVTGTKGNRERLVWLETPL